MAVKYSRTKSTLSKWGDIIVEKVKRQLRIDGRTASGETGRSLRAERTDAGSKLSVQIRSREINVGGSDVLQAIDQGVQWPFGRRPSTTNIAYWMKKKGIKPRFKGRFVSATETNLRRAAFAIAAGIGRHGTVKLSRNKYGGTKIMDFVLIPMIPKMTSDISVNLGEDIQELINEQIPQKNKRK